MMVINYEHDLCKICIQPNTGSYWCQSCYEEVLEWVEYDKFENVEYLAESVYKAIWKDGYIYCWDSESNQWKRYREHYKKGQPVTLKCLHHSQNITFEFSKEVRDFAIILITFYKMLD